MSADRRPIPGLQEISDWGSAEVKLQDGTTKSPDASHYDPNAPEEPPDSRFQGYRKGSPTVVWEIGLSERARKLGTDCARWVGASGGNTNMAIGIDIASGPAANSRVMKAVTISVWTVRDFDSTDKETKVDQCGFLRRTDNKDDNDPTSPLADEYLFSLKWDDEVVTWRVGRETTKVSGVSKVSINQLCHLLLDSWSQH